MKKGVAYTGLGSIVLCLMIIVVLETIDVDFMTENLFVGIAGFGLLFGVALITFFVFLSQNKKSGKVIAFIFSSLFVLFSIVAFVDVINIYQDREAYENKNFSIIKGIPTDESFGDDGLIISFEIDGIHFSAMNTSTTEQEFVEKYKGQTIKVHYLPNSKMVIKMNRIEKN